MIYPDKIHVTTSMVGSHYDELDYLYRRIWGEHLHHGIFESKKQSKESAVISLIEMVAELSHLKAGMKLCDVGCGYGAASRYFAREYKANVTGVTVSNQQLEIAKKLYGVTKNPNLRICDWLKNDFSNDEFDVVVSIESSEHMIDKKLFFQEASRVLKPGGRLIVCAWISKETPTRWEVKHLLEPICREGRLPSLGSESDYKKFIKDAGFELESSIDLTDKVKRTWTLCIKGIAKLAATEPWHFGKLFRQAKNNQGFLKTLFRIRLAYETKSMGYIVFSAIKES